MYFEIGTNDLSRKALWPTISVIEYELVLDPGHAFSVRVLSPDRLVGPRWYRAPGTTDDVPVGIIFERIKN